ncbi:SDR family oxidoreductase [Arthrobacter pigmenti]
MKTAVIGATGTVGSRVVAKLKDRNVSPVEISRSAGVDLITGEGLGEALASVDVAIDVSNAFPPDETIGLHEALTSATRNIVDACTTQQVGHLVYLSISGVDKPVFDDFPYYVAKRSQDGIVAESSVPATVVKSTQFHEFATNPSAVSFEDNGVRVEDWLVQPVAADTVAEVLVEAALANPGTRTRTITGPEEIRLPDLTTKLLDRLGDARPVRATAASLPELSEGILLAPDHATVLGPDINTWLDTVNPPH